MFANLSGTRHRCLNIQIGKLYGKVALLEYLASEVTSRYIILFVRRLGSPSIGDCAPWSASLARRCPEVQHMSDP